jgi:glucan 1,3-beta-glucosidase
METLKISRAFLGNQQFTCRNLVFRNCETALQISWDWSWMMQGIDIQNSTTGVIIVGGVSNRRFNHLD